MSTRQAETELALFTLFAKSTGLPMVPGSIESRQPPEPDIRCILSDSGPTCFELVEIVDSDLAKAVGVQLKFQKRLETDAAASQIEGLGDALVFVSFSASSTNAQKQQACGALLTVIGQLPEGFRGDIDPAAHADLTGIVRKLRVTRGEFVGPAFQVDGGAFISDPIIARIQEKFAKKYTTDAPIDLLAYYQLHPTQRAEFELPGVREYVLANLPGSHFSRVWVFDAHNRSVLYCS
jgi:hypothetical protein